MQDHSNRISPSGKIRYEIVDRGHDTPCWEWQMAMTEKGYGQISDSGKTRRAHRFFYEAENGEIPEHLEIDHLCRNRACVNPDHLEAVSSSQNR